MGDHAPHAVHLHTLPDWQEFCEQCTVELTQRDPGAADELHASLEQIGSLTLSDDDRSRAHRLLTELSTRITSAPLRYRDGDEVAALSSLYQVFLKTREGMAASDGGAQGFSNVGLILLERILRPFTGYWHGRKERGALERQDERRRFRIELRRLRGQLDAFRGVLGQMAKGSLVPLPTNLVHSATSADWGRLWPDDYIGPVARTSDPPTLSAELESIRARRGLAYPVGHAGRELGGLGGTESNGAAGESVGLVGLALSGGGIRSATFCLGVVQVLAKHGLLRDVDYLSTVSGGGYFGSFLSSRLHWSKDESGDYDTLLREVLVDPDGRTGDSLRVRALRNNSKYLVSDSWRENFSTATKVARRILPFGRSLHDLYRDLLADGYLSEDDAAGAPRPIPTLTELAATPTPAPFHLVNTAVNLPASRDPELRGRRSDFFVLNPLFSGSVVTGYCDTHRLEDAVASSDGLNLATAMAISGAAASSHMGSKKVGLAARVGLVAANVRLGHWLPNPRKVQAGEVKSGRFKESRRRELFSNFDENDDFVNLSDGGHVENLGLYELLRRRCKFIVVVDGECDPQRTSGALIKAARLARIDLGVEIDVDVSDLHVDDDGHSQTHWAFGTIHYNPRGEEPEMGYLLYLKLSVTGNEPDYVKEYRARFPAFPHESTADQLFDEDQFEAYRALGEHVAEDLFGEDLVNGESLRDEPFRTRVWLQSLVREFL